jgi:catechol 2,3-dioxygenase-like lactoylglutathione lyase family enzyme
MTVKRMDNVGIVVADIDGAIEFFTELGLELEGRAPILRDRRSALRTYAGETRSGSLPPGPPRGDRPAHAGRATR